MSLTVFKSLLIVVALWVNTMSSLAQSGDTWQQVRQQKSGTVNVYWFESQPFITKGQNGMSGIEYDLLEDFKDFLKSRYDITLTLNWKEAKSFADTYRRIRDDKMPGTFGASAFSVTPERQLDVGFSPSYMADISVLITSEKIPIVKDEREFNTVFSRLTAITIHATTYEQDLQYLKDHNNIHFATEYIPSSQNILESIAAHDSAFGFIDLPVYLMMFADNPSVNVKRQNLYPVKRKGYAIIFPSGSDWEQALNEYFAQPDFEKKLEKIIGRYIDTELYRFVEDLAVESDDMVELLTKEKEIQYNELIGQTDRILRESRTKKILIALVAVSLASLAVIVVLYAKRSEQKRQIERQQESIERKNEQLEKRNHHLVTLDEEKNNLIKILAHDLRTPINHVQGLAQLFLLSNPQMDNEQKDIIRKISDASLRLTKMISNILDTDSLENNRVRILMDDVQLSTLVNQVAKSFEKQAQQKQTAIAFTSDAADLIIKGDSLFLTQIFENLIGNAIKFTPKEGRVTVQVTRSNEFAQVTIRDSGPGFTEQDKALLFRKFQRLSAKPTDGENSTGLGLFIVKKYVDLMNGVVSVDSEPGQGATFIVQFPLSKQLV